LGGIARETKRDIIVYIVSAEGIKTSEIEGEIIFHNYKILIPYGGI